MKKMLSGLLLGLGLFLVGVTSTQAQIRTVRTPVPSSDLTATSSATTSANATDSAALATASAVVTPEIKPDITANVPQEKDAFVAFLDSNPIGPVSWNNVLQHAIRNAINQGLPANIVVLIILFPLIASIIAASRHLVGLQGFGIYIPAVLSVAFVSTGIVTGIIMFIIVLVAASLFRTVIKVFQLQYLPRTALLLWGVSISVLVLLIVTTLYGVGSLLTVTIFPLLIIMLLTENFIETQLTSSQSQAFQLTLETLLVAIICSVIISSQTVQKTVLLWPELTLIAVAVVNLAIGKYSGLRLLEYLRFRSILEG